MTKWSFAVGEVVGMNAELKTSWGSLYNPGARGIVEDVQHDRYQDLAHVLLAGVPVQPAEIGFDGIDVRWTPPLVRRLRDKGTMGPVARHRGLYSALLVHGHHPGEPVAGLPPAPQEDA